MIIKATVALVRALSNPAADTLIFCTATKRFYFWAPADTTADDGEMVLKPDNITHPDPGRWLTTEATDPNA